MDCLEILQDKIEKEYADFKNSYLERDKNKIFCDAYKINVYTEFYEFLCNSGMLEEYLPVTLIQWLGEKNSILYELYQAYLKDEYASVNTFEDIRELIENFYQHKEIFNRE